MSVTLAIADPLGNPLDEWANMQDVGGQPGLEYALSVGGVGSLIVRRDNFVSARSIPLDGRLGAWRSFASNPPVLDCEAIFLARDYAWLPSSIEVTAYHVNSLFERRITAYDAGTSYTQKTGAPDDLIKAYVRENMGTGIVGADRDGLETQADISALVSVQANLTQVTSLSDASTRRRLDRVIAELSQAATTAGTYLVCEIVPTGSGGRSLEVRTYITQRGIDRRQGSGQELIFSEERGNIENVVVREFHRNEATVVIAGGSGEGAERAIQVAIDTARLSASPLNRCELFIEQTDTNDANVLLAKANAALRANAPTIVIEGDLIATPLATRGLHYNLGDLVTVEHPAGSFNVRLETLTVRAGNGVVRDRMRFRGVL